MKSIDDRNRRRSQQSSVSSCEVDRRSCFAYPAIHAHVGINAARFKRLLESCLTLGRDLNFQMFSSAALVTTARLRMLPTPSCTFCAVASHNRAQCSCRLKHLVNNLIAHFLLAGSNLLPAHSKYVVIFNYAHHLAQ